MKRKMYTPTESQEKRWAAVRPLEMPTDEEFKANWKRRHHGKLTGWGLGKRDFIVKNLKQTREYQMGLWQGSVDAARGIEYQHEAMSDENVNCYNLGYYRGYNEYTRNRRGWDAETRARFDALYLSDAGVA